MRSGLTRATVHILVKGAQTVTPNNNGYSISAAFIAFLQNWPEYKTL
jgi:hypothetical protein